MLGVGIGVLAVQQSGYDLPNGAPANLVTDFKNGVYQVDGVDQAGPLDIFADDAEVSGYHFDPATIIADQGMVATGNFDTSPILKPTFADAFLVDGVTFTVIVAEADGEFQFELFDNPNFNTDWFARIANNASVSWGDGTNSESDPLGDISGSLSKLVVNVTPTGFQMSANGRAVFGFTRAAPTPPFDAVAFRCITGTVERITVHELQDVADLPALSALG